MCGVFGYVGEQRAVGESIVEALKRLEYRGYDSWGLAIATPDGLVVEKEVGRLNGHVRAFPASTIGLGHTRLAEFRIRSVFDEQRGRIPIEEHAAQPFAEP